jgi:hypothetical protein
MAWLRLGVWKLRGLKKGVVRVRCPSSEEDNNESHVLL